LPGRIHGRWDAWPESSQASGENAGDVLKALFGAEVVGMVVRSHGTSPVELPQRPSPGDRHAGGRKSMALSVITRRGIEMTEIVKRIWPSSYLSFGVRS
jgi:hypothetical protein